MAEIPKVPALEKPAEPVSRWIARVMMAVILAEGIWGLLVSLIRDLAVPFLAKQMGGDPQSPLYLGKGNYDFPALFTAILELCLAGIVGVALNAWANRGVSAPRFKTVTVRKVVSPTPSKNLSIAPAPAQPTPSASIAPPPTPQVVAPVPPPAPVMQAAVLAPVAVAQSKPAPAPPPKPAKPKPPKEVYYNIVGEPLNPTEDE